MEEIIKNLQKTCEGLELIDELTLKYKDIKVVGEMLFYKELEEGILNKLMNANAHQLEIMKSSYRFRYYKKEHTDKIIDTAILNLTRKNKLNYLNSIN